MGQWELEYLRDEICHFPKHADETWYDVIQRDREYVRWLIGNIEDLDEDLAACLAWGVDHVPDRI